MLQLTTELLTLLIISVVYVTLRVRTIPRGEVELARPKSPVIGTGARDKANRRSGQFASAMSSVSLHSRGDSRSSTMSVASTLDGENPASVGSRGCVFGTEEREYR